MEHYGKVKIELERLEELYKGTSKESYVGEMKRLEEKKLEEVDKFWRGKINVWEKALLDKINEGKRKVMNKLHK